MIDMADYLRRRKAWIVLLLLCVTAPLLSCIYGLRTEYVITAAQPQLLADGWVVRPKILSTEVRRQSVVPDRPEEFAISFWATHPLKSLDSSQSFDDIAIDSIVVVYPPGTASRTFLLNEASFVSYRAVSKDSVMKRFSIIDPATHKLVWHPFPKDAGTLMLQVYVQLTPGKAGLRKDPKSGLELDTILPLRGESESIMPVHAKLETMVVRVDRNAVTAGILVKP